LGETTHNRRAVRRGVRVAIVSSSLPFLLARGVALSAEKLVDPGSRYRRVAPSNDIADFCPASAALRAGNNLLDARSFFIAFSCDAERAVCTRPIITHGADYSRPIRASR
jgi:hypothetical protein